MARPKLEINPEQVRQLARIGCTYPEMAAVLECSEMTLERRFVGIIKEGKEHLKASLRRMQYTSAQNGNVTMQIWLGKQLLNQKDEPLVDFSTHYHYAQINDKKLFEEAKSKGIILPSEIERRMNVNIN